VPVVRQADHHPADRRPLASIRVLDFSRHMAGPYAAVMLADYGADVVKVESLPDGDPSRRTGIDFIDGESALFLMWNRNKRSVALDLRQAEGLQLAHRLIEQADVLIENYRPGVADRIGIGWEAAHRLNPGLIYCSISGYGPTGPMAEYPATDPVVQAMSGVMSVTGEADGGPVLTGIPIADYCGALFASQGILAALHARQNDGEGQHVEVPLLGGLLFGLTTRLAHYWASGEEPRRFGSAHSVVVPYQAYETKDGHAMAGTWGPDHWPRFCAAVEMPELLDDPRYATNQSRMENRESLQATLTDQLRTRTTAEWAERFRAHGALFGPVATFGEILDHPQVRAMGLVQSAEHASLGEVSEMALPVSLSGTPPSGGVAAPLLGQHTAEVLDALGIDTEHQAALAAAGIVRLADAGSGPVPAGDQR
jgi:crotonobetainyl-CoA:carnitine CoA-transferase CaiB-like acyl-CoA transferase